MKKYLTHTALAATLCATAISAQAQTKVGMITTLSGGGAGLGIDVRDGFMLAIQQSGRDDIDVVIEDDQRKPDVAVQLADKMVQSEKVNSISLRTPARQRLQARAAMQTTLTLPGRTIIYMKLPAPTPILQLMKRRSFWLPTTRLAKTP